MDCIPVIPATKPQGDESGSRPLIQCFNYQPRSMQLARGQTSMCKNRPNLTLFGKSIVYRFSSNISGQKSHRKGVMHNSTLIERDRNRECGDLIYNTAAYLHDNSRTQQRLCQQDVQYLHLDHRSSRQHTHPWGSVISNPVFGEHIGPRPYGSQSRQQQKQQRPCR